MPFRFRQFNIEDSQSTQRVGTDSMLLGAWAEPENAATILDIGTGCGVLALMMAQKTGATIHAIDPDLLSILEARDNFTSSPWPDRLFAIQGHVQTFTDTPDNGYDYILTNPPFFVNSLKSPSARRNAARHDQNLTHDDLVQSVCRLLSVNGLFALILPGDITEGFINLCRQNRLELRRRTEVFSKPGSSAIRTMMEFSKYDDFDPGLKPGATPVVSGLTIRTQSGSFSAEYLAITGDFHQF